MTFDTKTPHIEPDWSDAFLLEMRLRGVDGRQIGAALAEVEAHCADSGESAADAFGDPVAYAVALAPTTAAPMDWRRELRTSGSGLLGMLIVPPAVAAWKAGERVEVTVGLLVVAALLLATTALIVRYGEQILRAVITHWWLVAIAATAPLAVSVGILMIADQTLFSVPPLGVLVLGVVLLAVSTALSLRDPLEDDPIVGPDGADTLPTGKASRRAAQIGPWLLPLLTLLLMVPILLFG